MIDNNPKILIVPGWYPSIAEPFNGDFIRDQVVLLRKEGLKIDVVFADLNIAYFKRRQWTKRYSVSCDVSGNKDYIVSGPFWPKNNFWGFERWVKAYVNWIEEYFLKEGFPDVIHAHTYLGAIVSNKIKIKYNIPFIVTEHYTGWMDGSIRRLHRRLGTNALISANVVTAVSPALQSQLTTTCLKTVLFLPNFIDTEIFRFFNLCKNDFPQVICIGDLISRKRVDHAIRVVAELNKVNWPVRLTIIGSGSHETALRSLIKKLHLDKSIKLVGQKTHKEVATYLASCDLLLHTSSLETFGLTIAEALCCGLQVASYDNKGVHAMSEFPGIYICEKHEPKEMAKLIIDHFDFDERKKITRSTFAINHLGVKGIKPQLDRIYNKLLV